MWSSLCRKNLSLLASASPLRGKALVTQQKRSVVGTSAVGLSRKKCAARRPDDPYAIQTHVCEGNELVLRFFADSPAPLNISREK